MEATSFAVTVAVNWEALTKVVGSGVEFSCTVELGANPKPLTVSVKLLEPACTKAGEINATAGAKLYVLPVMVVVDTTVLLAGFGSPCGALTDAVFVSVPGESGVTVI
jgi:hypothetical protein